MREPLKFAAVILAAGKSSRMGQDKAFLEIGGQTLLARQIALAREIGATEIYISGRPTTDYSPFGCRVLHDQFPGSGPLSGIARALSQTTAPLLLVLAVDLPAMTSEFLRQLLVQCAENSGVIPSLDGHLEPLAAIYPRAARPLAEAMLSAGQNAAAKFATRCVASNLAQFHECRACDQNLFTNWNSPSDCILITGNNA